MDEAGRNQYYNTRLFFCETEEDEAILDINDWQDIMVEVTLDSSACHKVMARDCAPVYPIQNSKTSRRGLGFIVGNGEPVPNEGQSILNLEADNDRRSQAQLASTFQMADLTRPLAYRRCASRASNACSRTLMPS